MNQNLKEIVTNAVEILTEGILTGIGMLILVVAGGYLARVAL